MRRDYSKVEKNGRKRLTVSWCGPVWRLIENIRRGFLETWLSRMSRIRKWKEEGNALGEGNLKEGTEAVPDAQHGGGEACLAEVRRQK